METVAQYFAVSKKKDEKPGLDEKMFVETQSSTLKSARHSCSVILAYLK